MIHDLRHFQVEVGEECLVLDGFANCFMTAP